MGDFKLQPQAEDHSSMIGPAFPETLMPGANLDAQKEMMQKQFADIEAELQGMRIELAEVPSSESLVKLYEIQSKGRAYFERSSEIFRQYLKFSSTITLLRQRVDLNYNRIIQETTTWVRTNMAAEYKATKSGDERTAMVMALIPQALQEEHFRWMSFEQQVKINYQVVKSFNEQFKSVRDDILVQLSIIKNLIMLGDLKLDPEAMRAFRVIEASYRPTRTDFDEKRAADTEAEVSFEEGVYNL